MMWSQNGRQRLEYVAPSGMGNNLGNGSGAPFLPEAFDRPGCQLRDRPVKQVAEFSVTLFKPQFVAIAGEMNRIEIGNTQAAGGG